MGSKTGLSRTARHPPYAGPAPSSAGPARQRRLRLYGPFPARVRGADARGEWFEADAVVDDISPGGMYLRVGRRVEPGARLFVVTRFSPSWSAEARAPLVAVRGRVLRVEALPGGGSGAAVAFTRHRFL